MGPNSSLKLMTSCIDGKPRNYKKYSSNASNRSVPGSVNVIKKINKGWCHYKNNYQQPPVFFAAPEFGKITSPF